MNLSSNRINQNSPRNGRAPQGRTPQGRVPANRATAQPPRPQVQQANTMSSYGTTTKIRSLYPGQIIKGEVSDLRNNEVMITLENNTTVAGKLENGNWLSIGDIAAFKVASASQELIVLEALPKSESAIANSMIQKALEEANIPKTGKNQQIVLELMNNKMPINKNAIQQMIQQSFQHQDIRIPTLVTLNKLKIPVTSANATQFEHYQSKQHALADHIEVLSNKVCSLIKDMAQEHLPQNITNNLTNTLSPHDAQSGDFIHGTDPSIPNAASNTQESVTSLHMTDQVSNDSSSTGEVPESPEAVVPNMNNSTSTHTYNGHPISPRDAVIQQLTANTIPSGSQNSSLPFPTNVSRILSAVLDNNITAELSSRAILPDMPLNLSEANKTELLNILENFELSDTQKEAIQQNSATLRDVIHLIHADFEKAFALDQEVLSSTESSIPKDENSISGETSENMTILPETDTEAQTKTSFLRQALSALTPGRNSESSMLHISIFDNPVIQQLENTFTEMQAHNNELGGCLSNIERIQFADIANRLPLDDSMKAKIFSGEINTTELLRVIKTILPFADSTASAELLSSDTFFSLLQKEITDAFLLTPQDFYKQNGIHRYYQKVEKQLEDMEELLKQPLLHNKTIQAQQNHTNLQAETQQTVSQLKDNLDFMKVLNQFFSYIQLPTKLQDKCNHAELYVYTKKKKLEQQQNPIHVLLQLDMDHLGSVQIDVKLNQQTLSADFRLQDDKAIQLLNNNLFLLEETLLEKGFLCKTSVSKLEKEVNPVTDFIEPENLSNKVTRYSFDLRA